MKVLKNLLLISSILVATSVARAQVVTATTAECATSIDGSVVQVPNPLSPPIVTPQFSGSLPSGTYYVEIVWYDLTTPFPHTTLASPEVQVQLTGTGELQVSEPASGLPSTAGGAQIFIGTTSGGETFQGSVVGSGTYTQSTPITTTGGGPPSTNTTICHILANDAGWPTGTGYSLSVTTPAGNTLPGFPTQVQLLGPGNTINLSNGLPFYNGVVTYPVPLLARPYGNAPQGVSGPLSLTGFNLFNVGQIGVGTPTPGWGLDIEGSGSKSRANANGGYIVNGTPPTANTCLGSTDGIANDTQVGCILPTSALIGQTALTSITAGPGGGTGASGSCGVGFGNCIDAGGIVTVVAGSSPPTLGTVATVVFGGTHNHAYCTAMAYGALTAPFATQIYVQPTATGFLLNNAGSTALAASTVYSWNYTCTFN